MLVIAGGESRLSHLRGQSYTDPTQEETGTTHELPVTELPITDETDLDRARINEQIRQAEEREEKKRVRKAEKAERSIGRQLEKIARAQQKITEATGRKRSRLIKAAGPAKLQYQQQQVYYEDETDEQTNRREAGQMRS